MSSNILILALTCVAMSPFVSANVASTLCDINCDLVRMENACRKTINDCTAVLDDRVTRLIDLLNVVLRELILLVATPLFALTPLVSSGLRIGLLNLILTIICLLINIILRWLAGLITTAQCRILITNWYNTSYLSLILYSTNPILVPIINVCLTIILELYSGCLLNFV